MIKNVYEGLNAQNVYDGLNARSKVCCRKMYPSCVSSSLCHLIFLLSSLLDQNFSTVSISHHVATTPFDVLLPPVPTNQSYMVNGIRILEAILFSNQGDKSKWTEFLIGSEGRGL